jgi:hypothetical protein
LDAKNQDPVQISGEGRVKAIPRAPDSAEDGIVIPGQ